MKTVDEFKSKNTEELNKDAEVYTKKVGINVNHQGELYCPCRVVTGNKEKDKEIICPCIFHRGEIELQKHCLCNLFIA